MKETLQVQGDEAKFDTTTSIYSIELLDRDGYLQEQQQQAMMVFADSDVIGNCIVRENIRLTDPTWVQDIRLITLELTKDMHYEPGDVAAVYYRSSPVLVSKACRIFCSEKSGLTPESIIRITKKSSQHFDRPSRIRGDVVCTIKELFSDILDIGAIPKRSFFDCIHNFAASSEEKEKLIELASAEGTDLYFEYCVREKKSFIEVLEEFRSVELPMHYLLECLPVIPPRLYSIASSPHLQPDQVI